MRRRCALTATTAITITMTIEITMTSTIVARTCIATSGIGAGDRPDGKLENALYRLPWKF
jgi:hypothetical protein